MQFDYLNVYICSDVCSYCPFQLEHQPKQCIDLSVQTIHILKVNINITFTLKRTQWVFLTHTIVILGYYHLIASTYHCQHIP